MEIPNPSRAARVSLRLGARVSRVLGEGTDFEAVMDVRWPMYRIQQAPII
jgi:hypothetical protein